MAFEKKDPDELGALWARTYVCKKTGDTLTRLTGTVDGVEVVCWPIDKQHDNQPTYRVKRSRPRVGGKAAAPAPTPVTDDEIPF